MFGLASVWPQIDLGSTSDRYGEWRRCGAPRSAKPSPIRAYSCHCARIGVRLGGPPLTMVCMIVVGSVAHVDAGKTTLSEALLYQLGAIRKMGRVDHGDAFLDSDAMERQRGITIFAEPAVVHDERLSATFVDTPGHVDFAAETERVLRVLDYAILVVSAADGIQGHTETLWRLLQRYNVPTVVFVNKTDMPGVNVEAVFAQMRSRWGDCCVDASAALPLCEQEDVALADESAMEELLADGVIAPATLRRMVAQRSIVPCFFGSALRMDGVDAFIDGFSALVEEPVRGEDFAARVYKVSHDVQGNRLTWFKVTGGVCRAKSVVAGVDASGRAWSEKIDQIRVYSGSRFTTVDEVAAGSICAVTGLSSTFPGEGLGAACDDEPPVLQPVLTYTVLSSSVDVHRCLVALRELEDEDPLLHVVWQECLQEIHVQLMGAVQLEVVQQMMLDRFGITLEFGPGGILYKETVSHVVEGVGHFEPLRHYAEAHVAIEPLPRGSGVRVESSCSEDVLDRNWQRLIMSHLREREHRGVLTGFPLTDVRLRLLTGRAHVKHTEGGDFREATYRAVRQGLMVARERGWCVLLEPWYRFRAEVPAAFVGRVMADVQRMEGVCDAPQVGEDWAVLSGGAPVSSMRDYALEVHTFTHGRGRIACVFDGYRPCHDADVVVERTDYIPEADVEHTPDSVFCAHGAGYPVKWYKVADFMHVDAVLSDDC